MGRGRAKAKQTKVARELKYYSPETDLRALERELHRDANSSDKWSADESGEDDDNGAQESPDLDVLVAQTVAGLQRGSGGAVTASVLKRTLLRKDSTFSEAAHGFRAFGELLEHLAARGIIELTAGPAKGDPEVTLPEGGRPEAFALLADAVEELDEGDGVALSGLKDQLRSRRPGFSEKPLGYGSFLQFCRGAAAAGVIELERDGSAYLVHPAS